LLFLTNLTELYLDKNQLRELPGEIGHLTNLTELYLWGNQLSELPGEICQLINLTTLDLEGNQLSELPGEIGLLKNLKKLALDGNPLVFPPKSITSQGTEAIINYLAAMLNQERMKWTAKVLIVGDGYAGKSCLLDSLDDQPFVPGKPMTRGIDIRTLNLPHPQKDNITMELRTWDFGGQEIYHAVHQFYLTGNSLFLLVWNTRQGFDAGKIDKWLKTVKALAPNAPIFLVATHARERKAELPKDKLSREYPEIAGFFEVDNETGEGIPQLKERIRETAATLKYMGMEHPVGWSDAADVIKNLDRKHMTKHELEDIFGNSGVSQEEFETLAVFLHEIGDILYYPDEEMLRDTIIIEPRWVSEQIVKILDSPELSEKRGFLEKPLRQELWSDMKSEDVQRKLLRLMEKFDLCHRTEDDLGTTLILGKLEPEEDIRYKSLWKDKEDDREIAMKFELKAIPAGIPTWFIARTHRFTTYIQWENGVLLEDHEKNHLGLLIADPDKKEIRLRVRGPMPPYFFGLLWETLEEIFDRHEGLEIVRKIPCPGHKGKKCPHEFDLDALKMRLEKKPPKLTTECAVSMEDVSIPELLFGLTGNTVQAGMENMDRALTAEEMGEQRQEDA